MQAEAAQAGRTARQQRRREDASMKERKFSSGGKEARSGGESSDLVEYQLNLCLQALLGLLCFAALTTGSPTLCGMPITGATIGGRMN